LKKRTQALPADRKKPRPLKSSVRWSKILKKQISISTNLPPLYGLLNHELPEGVSIASSPPMERRGVPGWDVVVNFDI